MPAGISTCLGRGSIGLNASQMRGKMRTQAVATSGFDVLLFLVRSGLMLAATQKRAVETTTPRGA